MATLGGWLRKLVDQPAVTSRPAPAPADRRPPPPPAPARGSLAAQALADAVQRVTQVVAYVGPELSIVACALAATALPGRGRPWPEVPPALAEEADAADLSPDERSWLLPLAKRLVASLEALKKSHMAVTQWGEARTRLAEAERWLGRLAQLPPEKHGALLANVEVGKLKASALPLTHLHLYFAGLPVLEDLFAPPEPA